MPKLLPIPRQAADAAERLALNAEGAHVVDVHGCSVRLRDPDEDYLSERRLGMMMRTRAALTRTGAHRAS